MIIEATLLLSRWLKLCWYFCTKIWEMWHWFSVRIPSTYFWQHNEHLANVTCLNLSNELWRNSSECFLSNSTQFSTLSLLLPPASEGGGYVFTGVCLSNFPGGGGLPHLAHRDGVPHLADRGYPILPNWGGYPGYIWVPLLLVRNGGGYPYPDLGRVPPHLDLGWGYLPPHPDLGPGQEGTPNWNSMACACYVAGGLPLAFTKEDFLVLFF